MTANYLIKSLIKSKFTARINQLDIKQRSLIKHKSNSTRNTQERDITETAQGD